MTTTRTAPLALADIAAAAFDDATLNVSPLYVENIGGGVAALVTYGGLTITLDGGQRVVDIAENGPAEVLVCFDGGSDRDVTGTASTVAEVLELIGTAVGRG